MKCPTCGKVAHPTKGEAVGHLISLRKAGGAPDLVVYRCGEAWHVGHNAVKFRKRIRAALSGARRRTTNATRSKANRR